MALGGAGPEPLSHGLNADSWSQEAPRGGPAGRFWGMEQPPRVSGPEDTRLVS